MAGSARSRFWPGRTESLYYRVFGRGKDGKTELRSAGPLAEGKTIDAFGGGANMPMTISFRVDEYLPAGVEKQIYEPVVLPKSQMEEAVPASLIEMTVGDNTKEIWLQRRRRPREPRSSRLRSATSFTRSPTTWTASRSGFDLKLEDFEVGFEPGTEQATKFVSKVRLTDSSEGIRDRPYTISMNEPMSHRGYTFYQMRATRRSSDPAHRPAHRAVPVGLPGGDRSRPADQVRRLHAPRAGHLSSVLHESRGLHRRRQAGTRTSRARRRRGATETRASNRGSDSNDSHEAIRLRTE